MDRTNAERQRRYIQRLRFIRTETIPRTVPAGRVLAHNHVRHTIDMTQGRNGFRAWTWPKAKKPRHFMLGSHSSEGITRLLPFFRMHLYFTF
jgi:hypothetical protein